MTNQELAIKSYGKNIILSASAGTGKTYVLINRIVELLKRGEDISTFLVVTFGTDAAKEIKDRVTTALENEKELKGQAKKLSTSSISTIHAFLSDLLKTYFYAVGLSPKFKIGQDSEVAMLSQQAMDKVFAEKYESKDEEFFKVLDYFSYKRKDGKLRSMILQIYEMKRSMPKETFFDRALSSFKAKSHESYVFQEMKDTCHEFLKRLKEVESLKHINETKAAYSEVENFLNGFLKLESLKSRDIELLKGFSFSYKNSRLSENFGYDQMIALRDEVKAFQKNLVGVSQILAGGEEKEKVYFEILKGLITLTRDFEKSFATLKIDGEILDFSDLEHFGMELLENQEIKKEIQEKFKFVFVDEYQDTSLVQEKILSQISNGCFFYVGDVKQSIYGFRLCDVEIFKDKALRFEEMEDSQTISMMENYRTEKNILDFVNHLFKRAMKRDDLLDYERSSFVTAAKSFESLGKVEISLGQKEKKKPEEILKVYDILEDEGEKEENENAICEAKVIEKVIRKHLGQVYPFPEGEREFAFSDFAILSRSTENIYLQTIVKYLSERGIPCSVYGSEQKIDRFSEILMIVDFLKTLVSQSNDISLVATLKSEFFNFTDSELFEISQKAGENFAAKLKSDGFSQRLTEKIQSFLKDLERYRSYGLKGASFALRQAITEKKVLLKLSSVYGESHSENVENFLKILDGFEEVSLSGVAIKLEENLSNLKISTTFGKGNAVKVMTIHKSKGLEFPIMILSGAHKRFVANRNFLEKDLGIGFDFHDQQLMKKSPTIQKLAISKKLKAFDREENLRLLYVALTRGKLKVYVTGVDPEKEDYEKEVSFLSLIFKFAKKESPFHTTVVESDVLDFEPTTKEFEMDETIEGEVLKTLNFQYNFMEDTKGFSKVSASLLAKDDETHPVVEKLKVDTSKELGTNYHKAIEKLDFFSTLNECERFLSSIDEFASLDPEKVFKAVNLEIVKGFEIFKEKKFIMEVSPKDVGLNGEKHILCQGVIDLLCVKDQRAVVLDFKATSEKNEKALKETYGRQLKIYKLAVEKILKIPCQTFLYSVLSEDLIEM